MLIRLAMTKLGFVHEKDMPYVLRKYAEEIQKQINPIVAECQSLRDENAELRRQLADTKQELQATARTARDYWERMKRKGTA